MIELIPIYIQKLKKFLIYKLLVFYNFNFGLEINIFSPKIIYIDPSF